MFIQLAGLVIQTALSGILGAGNKTQPIAPPPERRRQESVIQLGVVDDAADPVDPMINPAVTKSSNPFKEPL